MAELSLNLHKKSFGATFRSDKWWVEPMTVLLGLSFFIAYLTWAAFQGNNYWYGSHSGFGGYLSPLYSPLVYIKEGVQGSAPVHHALLGSWPSWWPNFLPASPAFLILIFPGLFRFTCYYYRGAYYKAFAGSPPACGVGAVPQKKYKGETFLLIFQNLHRFALYFALLYIPILYFDAIQGFFQNGKFGIGVGSIILTINATLILSYTFGCHSFRHLIGGRKDCFSCAGAGRIQNAAYKKSSWLNTKHKLFAWSSLFFVAFTDVYVRLVASGTITDLNTWNL
jgi:hypothetical protein